MTYFTFGLYNGVINAKNSRALCAKSQWDEAH